MQRLEWSTSTRDYATKKKDMKNDMAVRVGEAGCMIKE